ncbi:hypothetical protein EV421DRAFT_1739073 [Armillaria borealis]|uniref:Uncharacterized protein n=1 Tax=Armillaria borealis TaxID=47425 RepID=A0AA39J8E6_9AGAR|nr:hypothetical protein EV421DRAFT_1739073 [Armillaria borealis]
MSLNETGGHTSSGFLVLLVRTWLRIVSPLDDILAFVSRFWYRSLKARRRAMLICRADIIAERRVVLGSLLVMVMVVESNMLENNQTYSDFVDQESPKNEPVDQTRDPGGLPHGFAVLSRTVVVDEFIPDLRYSVHMFKVFLASRELCRKSDHPENELAMTIAKLVGAIRPGIEESQENGKKCHAIVPMNIKLPTKLPDLALSQIAPASRPKFKTATTRSYSSNPTVNMELVVYDETPFVGKVVYP